LLVLNALKMKNLMLIFAAAFLMLACSKEEALPEISLTEDAITAEDIALIEMDMSFVDDLAEMEMQAHELGTGGRIDDSYGMHELLRVCGERTWERIDANTRKLTIDFGPDYCQTPDGMYRKGKIIIVYYGRPTAPQAYKKVITYERYFVNRNGFGGTLTITHVARDTWNRVMENGFILHPDGKRTIHNYRHQVVRVRGGDTPERDDDVTKTEGQGFGMNRGGTRIQYRIAEPLIRKFERGCARYFVKGVTKINDGTGRDISLDYDPGNNALCDNIAALTIDGETRRIELKHPFFP